jgi:ribosomal protein L35AE/L33A
MQATIATFTIISRSDLLRMNKSLKCKFCIKSKHTFYVQKFLFFKNRAFYEIMKESIAQTHKPQTKIWRTRFARCIPKATNTH